MPFDARSSDTLLESLDAVWLDVNRCNQASPYFWVLRDLYEIALFTSVACYALLSEKCRLAKGSSVEHWRSSSKAVLESLGTIVLSLRLACGLETGAVFPRGNYAMFN